MKKLSVASFFSGCGGMDLGFEGGFSVHHNSIRQSSMIDHHHSNVENFVTVKKTAFETVFACDIKPSAKISWEGIFHLESIVDLVKKVKNGEFSFPKADLVTGGFPCQDFSIAGKRNGFNSQKTHQLHKDHLTVRDAIFDLCEPEQSQNRSHQHYSKAKWYGKHCQGQTEINSMELAPWATSLT